MFKLGIINSDTFQKGSWRIEKCFVGEKIKIFVYERIIVRKIVAAGAVCKFKNFSTHVCAA